MSWSQLWLVGCSIFRRIPWKAGQFAHPKLLKSSKMLDTSWLKPRYWQVLEFWLVVSNMNFIFHICHICHNPNWRSSMIEQRVGKNPTICLVLPAINLRSWDCWTPFLMIFCMAGKSPPKKTRVSSHVPTEIAMKLWALAGGVPSWRLESEAFSALLWLFQCGGCQMALALRGIPICPRFQQHHWRACHGAAY